MQISPKLKHFFAPVGLLLLIVIGYGVLAPRLGFYLDDWYIIWINKMFGASRFIEFFKGDRPLFAYVYMVFVPIFKDSALGWQIFALFTRWLAVCSFYYLLRMLLPKQRTLSLAAAALFTVYPGFQFHWFSVMYSQVYFLMTIFFASYIFMIIAVRTRKHMLLLFLAAIICQFIGIAPMEYFYGLELFRPILLYIVLVPLIPAFQDRIKRTMLYWLPFLSVFAGFTGYRLVNSGLYSYQTNLLSDLESAPISTILELSKNVYHGIWAAMGQVWLDLPKIFTSRVFSSLSLEMTVLIGVGVLIMYALLTQASKSEGNAANITVDRILIWTGLFLALFGMIPFIMGGFQLSLKFPENRYLLSMAPGIALFLTGFIDLFLGNTMLKYALFALLIGLSIGSQFQAADGFMTYWNNQKDFFEQLSWRIPSMKPNTILISEDLNFSQYFSGPSLTAPLNLTYAPENTSNQIPYLMFLFSGGQAPAIPVYQANLPVSYSFRSLVFRGSTSSMIAFYKPSDGCIQVLSAEDTADQFNDSHYYDIWKDLIPLSNLDQIIASPASPGVPPEKYFGAPDINQWCYYFEKADLAKQNNDWQEVLALYQQADSKGFQPGPAPEWLPMLDALYNTGQTEQAMELTRKIPLSDPSSRAVICNVWNHFESQSNLVIANKMMGFLEEIGCNMGSL